MDAVFSSVTEALTVPPAEVALQVNVTPFVSLVTVEGPQPVVDVTVDSASVTVQVTATSDVYQPLLPSVPATPAVMFGGVLSATGEQSIRGNVSPLVGSVTWKVDVSSRVSI